MILRIIRGRADEPRFDALRVAVEDIARDPGRPTRFHLATRQAGEPGVAVDVLIISYWSSAEAAMAADARGISPVSIAQAVGLHDFDAALFEIDEKVLRHAEGDLIAIRVAIGRFSRPGADIEAQALLRERLPHVDEDMAEAYVGRRMVGRAVDVAFVSVWQRFPTDRSLEDVFWPDISLRYDSFEVGLYTPVRLPAHIG